ncbi:hypothetical protein WMF30_10335 [Sorangium sp. So ce134]
MSDRMGRRRDDLAKDLLPLAERRETGAAVPWVAIGEIVQEAEELQRRGTLSHGSFASMRRRALDLVVDLPGHRQTEALMSLDALDPRRT